MRFPFRHDLILNKRMRKELSKPFGVVIKNSAIAKLIKKTDVVYAVGDVTVATLLSLGYMPKVSIFDFRTERSKRVYPIIRRVYRRPIHTKNRSGGISKGLWYAVMKASKSDRPVGILVDGEEDLASLACIHFAGTGDLVIYGLRGRGMTRIRVDKRIKRYVLNVLEKMSNAS